MNNKVTPCCKVPPENVNVTIDIISIRLLLSPQSLPPDPELSTNGIAVTARQLLCHRCALRRPILVRYLQPSTNSTFSVTV